MRLVYAVNRTAFRISTLLFKNYHTTRPFLIGASICAKYPMNMEKREPLTLKIDTPEFRSILMPELQTVTSLFHKYNYELRIAGGAVRDLLMGIRPEDIDFATTATPAQMKDMFNLESIRMLNTNGEKHGTITARINDSENFECTTLRIDIRTDGRHAEVQWTTEWQLDALRRDLTVNSLFLGLDGTVYDYFNGIEDLKNKRVRFVGSAPDRIQEDYLRILRYFRFFGRIVEDPNSHDEETLKGIRENVDGLKNISGERLWVELRKILTGHHATPIIRVMHELGVTDYLGLGRELNLEELERVCARTEGLQPHATTRLAALMHTTQEMYTLNERLRLSKEELRNGTFIIEHRDDPRDGCRLTYCQDLHCDSAGKEPKIIDRIAELLKYVGDTETLERLKDWKPLRFPVNGTVLMERGVPKGKALALTLNDLRGKWKESGYKLSVEELYDRIEEMPMPAKKSKTS